MHILIGLLTVISLVAIWYWRARMASQASREILDASTEARAALRRFGYRRKAGQHPTESIEDPRLAAAGMMAALAKMDGELTADQINALRVECRASFRVDQREADDIAAYGRWISSQSKDPGESMRRLTPIIREQAPKDAQADLIPMLTRIASVEGGAPSDMQSEAIKAVQRGLALA